MTNLQQSNSSESIEQAQRSLATARSCQLDPTVGSLPQFGALMQFVDLCSALQNFDPAQASSKIQAMQAILETVPDSNIWTPDGSFAIPIRRPEISVANLTNGVVRPLPDGTVVLMFNWMPRQDIYALCCLLSGIALSHRNTIDGQKAEQMLREGLRTLDSQYRCTRHLCTN
jgi:hypothetical protein